MSPHTHRTAPAAPRLAATLLPLALVFAAHSALGAEAPPPGLSSEQLKAMIRAQLKGVEGRPRPEFSLPDLDGKTRSIGEWDGKVVLLNFWASWCPPCRREMPDLQALNQRFGAQGFAVIGLAVDATEPASAFVLEQRIDFPILIGGRAGNELAQRYGNAQGALPYSVLIDRAGTIRHAHLGQIREDDLTPRIEALLR